MIKEFATVSEKEENCPTQLSTLDSALSSAATLFPVTIHEVTSQASTSIAKPGRFINNGLKLDAQVLDIPSEMEGTLGEVAAGDMNILLRAELVSRLGAVVEQTHALEREGKGVDCFSFGVLMVGGTFPSAPHALYDRRNISYTMAFSNTEVITPELDAQLPSLELLGMGTPDMNGRFWPNHVFVRLPIEDSSAGVYVSKLSRGPVVFTDLSQLAKFYPSSHVGVISSLSMTRKDSGELVGTYKR